MKKHFLLIVLLSWGLHAMADSKPVTQKQSELKKMASRIVNLKSTLQSKVRQKSTLEHELQQTDLQIAKLSLELDGNNKKMQQQQRMLQQFKQNETDYAAKLSDQNDELNKQLRAAYILSRESSIKVVLNQENPERINRILNYYYYFDQARLQLVTQLNQTLHELKANQSAIQQQATALQQSVQQQQIATTQLQTIKKTRVAMIHALATKINDDQQNLTQLQAEKEALSHVIQKLLADQRQVALHSSWPIHGSFATMLGKLHWPLTTHYTVHYGLSGQGHADISTNAVILQAAEGDSVFAIYPGRVVFAGWLRGFGLMLIIDHGQGYMSLYGRNDSLYHRTGDFVQAGELIAKVGNSGGYEESGLYFAIRHNGKPTDPRQWCRT